MAWEQLGLAFPRAQVCQLRAPCYRFFCLLPCQLYVHRVTQMGVHMGQTSRQQGTVTKGLSGNPTELLPEHLKHKLPHPLQLVGNSSEWTQKLHPLRGPQSSLWRGSDSQIPRVLPPFPSRLQEGPGPKFPPYSAWFQTLLSRETANMATVL